MVLMQSYVSNSQRLFARLGIDPAQPAHSRPTIVMSAVRNRDPDATVRDCVVALVFKLQASAQKPSVILQHLAELDMLSDFAVPALPAVAALCTHRDVRVARAALIRVQNIGTMAINGGHLQNVAFVQACTASVVQAFEHLEADVQKDAFKTYGALAVAAIGRNDPALAADFGDLSCVTTSLFARKFVRDEAQDVRQAITLAKAA